MSPIILNDPLNILWQTNLYDALMLTLFLSAAVYATLQFRRGRRIYAVLLFAALIYGQVLELAGMATLNMYVQGDFSNPGAKKEITLHCIPNAGRSGCQLNGTGSLAKSNRTRRICRSVIAALFPCSQQRYRH